MSVSIPRQWLDFQGGFIYFEEETFVGKELFRQEE